MAIEYAATTDQTKQRHDLKLHAWLDRVEANVDLAFDLGQQSLEESYPGARGSELDYAFVAVADAFANLHRMIELDAAVGPAHDRYEDLHRRVADVALLLARLRAAVWLQGAAEEDE